MNKRVDTKKSAATAVVAADSEDDYVDSEEELEMFL
jgi:hypothetical protein